MSRGYYGTKLSENIIKTPEGFLIAKNVPICRTGWQQYAGHELDLDKQIVDVYRDPKEVFDPATIASFEGKCVTDGHPAQFINSSNVSGYSRGHIQDVHRGADDFSDCLIADIHIKDAILVAKVEPKAGLREISCGYDCEYQPIGDDKYGQKTIRGNHIAVVLNGRAGDRIKIRDEFKESEHPREPEGKFTEKWGRAAGAIKEDDLIDGMTFKDYDKTALEGNEENIIKELTRMAREGLDIVDRVSPTKVGDRQRVKLIRQGMSRSDATKQVEAVINKNYKPIYEKFMGKAKDEYHPDLMTNDSINLGGELEMKKNFFQQMADIFKKASEQVMDEAETEKEKKIEAEEEKDCSAVKKPKDMEVEDPLKKKEKDEEDGFKLIKDALNPIVSELKALKSTVEQLVESDKKVHAGLKDAEDPLAKLEAELKKGKDSEDAEDSEDSEDAEPFEGKETPEEEALEKGKDADLIPDETLTGKELPKNPIPGADTATAVRDLIKAVKPLVASIKDEKIRKQTSDNLAKIFRAALPKAASVNRRGGYGNLLHLKSQDEANKDKPKDESDYGKELQAKYHRKAMM